MAGPIVEIKTGLIRGVIQKNEDGCNYYAFKGIPFAEPPLGNLRFQDPIPKQKWTGTLDCTNYGTIDFQYDLFTQDECYDEDSLHLNVFTHSIDNPNAKVPVMVYIHGGDFTFGGANELYCGPSYLMRKKIVLVTVNFRLGVIGFLDLEDEIAPGNQGLEDQVLTLQWVQENIRVFGGDSNNVTVFGVSSGSASAHYLALSPLTENGNCLMHKVISQGTVVYNPWIAVCNPRTTAIKLCSLLGKELVDSQEIVEFLRTVDFKTFLKVQISLRKIVNYYPFGPGVDKKAPNPFMPLYKDIAADAGVHLPYLTGYNSHEGLITLLEITRKDFFKMCDTDFENILRFNGQEILKRCDLSFAQLRRLYYKSERVSDENLSKFVDLATDLYFTKGIGKFIRVQSERSSAPTYMYRFCYDSPNSLSKYT